MITAEDYELAYMFHNESMIFESTCDALEIKALTEDVEYIEESLKDNLTKYVNTIVTNVQNVWNKFQGNIAKNNIEKNKKDIEAALVDYKPNINVENYVNYDPSPLTTFHLNALEYGTMKDNLEDVPSFFKRYYANIYKDDSKSFKENLSNAVRKGKEDNHTLTRDELREMYNYMREYTDNIVQDINKDVQALNNSVKNSQHINFVVNSSTPPGQNVSAAAMIYMVEDTGDNKITSGNAENPGQRTTNPDDEKKNQEAEGVKRVQNYFKAATQIISAKMGVSREVYNTYNKFVMKHTKDAKEIRDKFNKEQKEKQAQEQNSGQTVKTVDTRL